MPAYLSADQILEIHSRLVEIFAGLGDPISPSGPRDENLVHSAAYRPKTALGNTEKYPSVVSKAAALFHSLVTNHPFRNGNKRTALVSVATFLGENHRRLTASDDDLFTFVTSVAQGRVPKAPAPTSTDVFVAEIADWIEAHSAHLQDSAKTMKMREFVDYTVGAGVRAKNSKNGYLLIGTNHKSVRISGSTKELSGSVVRAYLKKLGLSEAESGIRFSEFQAGLIPEQSFIQTLLSVLRRLASA